MNLKRLRGIAAVALTTIAVALIAGCSNSMAGSVDGGSNARMATLSLSATGIPNDYAEQFARSYSNVAARSITPNAPYDVSTTGLTFKLSGKSETGKVLAETQVYLKDSGTTTTGDATGKPVYDFYSDSSTTSAVTLDAMSWNLKLVAYNAAGDAVLQGFCSVDLRTGSGTAKFTMGTAGLDDKGSVDISGKFVDTDDAAASYSMGIYRKDTGEPLLAIKTDACNTTDGSDEDFTFNQTGVAPGTYLYTMIFYAETGCTGNIVGSFTDTLVVDPGNDLVRTLKIDVIGKKPKTPEHLYAYLVNKSEGKDGSPTYNVKVEWTKSLYATNYELQVLEYKDDATDFIPVYDTTTDELNDATKGNWIATTYGMRSMDPATTEADKTIENFAGSAVYGTGDGSSYMMFGDTSCILSLETGKIYEIRLRGRNYIGVSKFTEREESTTDANHSATNFTGFAADAAKKDHINRLLVTYHLNGGTLAHKITDSNTETFENVYAEYKSWTPNFAATTTNTELVKHVDNGEYVIKNGESAFDSWLFEKGEGLQDDGNTPMKTINSATANASKEKVTNFTYKNLTVIANYGNKVTGNISMGAALEDIDLQDISVAFNDTTLTATKLGSDVPINKYEITKVADDGTSSKNKLVITLAETNGGPYKDVSFTLIDAQNKQKTLPVDDNTSRTCTIDLTNYPTGNIQVMISAVTNKTTTVSHTLLFELQ